MCDFQEIKRLLLRIILRGVITFGPSGLLAAAIWGSQTCALEATFTDVNPDQSSGDAVAAWGRASGGRVNSLAVDPNNPLVRYAASEWSGLYKSVDGGLT